MPSADGEKFSLLASVSGFAADASTALCYFATVLPCKRFHCSPVTLIPGYTNPEFRATG
jgi:hypothetical protein